MHVEMSLDSEAIESPETNSNKPDDTQTISGSQVATAFARIEMRAPKKNTSNIQTLAISVAAVMSLVSLYLVFVLVL